MLVGITGGTGFVGRGLVLQHLAAGDSVRLLSRRSVKDIRLPHAVHVFHGDLTGPVASLASFVDGVDIVYHCAGEIREQTKMEAVHVAGTRNLCDAAIGKIRHWVQLSSVGAYGPEASGVVTEGTELKPVGVYEETKATSDQLVMNAAKEGGFTYSILRPSNVFGPNMTNQSLFQMMAMIDKGRFFFIGKKGGSANYIYVENVVDALMRCGNMPSAVKRIYNLSDHRTIEDFVEAIAKNLNKPVPKLRLPECPVRWIAKVCGKLPGFPLTESRVNALTNRTVYSIERIRGELDYNHQVSMEDGLHHMVSLWKQTSLNQKQNSR